MSDRDHRISRVEGEDGAGDGGVHGPGERTARDGEGVNPASDVERASGAGARAPTKLPAPPPREGEEPGAAESDLEAEEFRDDV